MYNIYIYTIYIHQCAAQAFIYIYIYFFFFQEAFSQIPFGDNDLIIHAIRFTEFNVRILIITMIGRRRR